MVTLDGLVWRMIPSNPVLLFLLFSSIECISSSLSRDTMFDLRSPLKVHCRAAVKKSEIQEDENMCVICIKEKGLELPDKNILARCFEYNRDGAGIMYDMNGWVRIEKGFMSFNDLWKRICELDEVIGLRNHAVVMHFRYATSGSKDPGNCHPYPISDKTERLRKTVTKCRHAAFCHNGVIPEYSFPNSALNDTQHFSKRVLSKLSRVDKNFFHREETRDFLHTLCRSKLCFLDSSGQIYTVGEFKQLGACKFSNLNFMNRI